MAKKGAKIPRFNSGDAAGRGTIHPPKRRTTANAEPPPVTAGLEPEAHLVGGSGVLTRLFHRRYVHVRERTIAQLVATGKYDWDTARNLIATLSNEDIDLQSDKLDPPFKMVSEEERSRGPAVGKLGDGTILNWLWDHREEIMKLILALVALFAAV